jgi:ankyrin repeat protein
MHHPPARAQVAINGLTPACIAALHGRSDHLRSLHNTGIDLNTTTYEDWSPALLAALNGHTNSLRFLASIGVNLHIATRLGTPLSIARESGHFQAANFILYTLLQDPQWLARTQAIIFNNSLRELVENDEVLFMANTDNSSSKPN